MTIRAGFAGVLASSIVWTILAAGPMAPVLMAQLPGASADGVQSASSGEQC